MPGESIQSLRSLSSELKQTIKEIRCAIKTLENGQIVAQRKAHGISVFFLINWSKYQSDTDSMAHERAQEGHTKGTPRAQEQECKNEELRKETYGQDFETFWTAYPKKVSKGHASKAYVSALKKTTPETILTALNKQIERGGFSSDPKFIPHAATWLNGERWADQVDAGKPQRRGDGGAMLPAGI